MASFFITGASRGLGLELVRQLAVMPSDQVRVIFASARSESPALLQLVKDYGSRVIFIHLEVTKQESAKGAAVEVTKILGNDGLDVLINNVGMMGYTLGKVDAMDNLEEHFTVNVLSAHYVSSAFIPLLEKGVQKKIVNISTTLGCMTLAPQFAFSNTPAYKITKTALHMLTVQYAQSYADAGFTVVAVSPGWLQTDMGNAFVEADLPVEVGAKATLDRVFAVKKDENGRALNVWVEGWEKVDGPNQYDGSILPW